jgi:hypothetical protein
MVRNHPFGVPNRGQIVRAVPLFEQRDIREQFRLRRVIDVKAERADAGGKHLAGGHAVSCSGLARTSLNPRLRCTSSSEIAAGVTPEMRAA